MNTLLHLAKTHSAPYVSPTSRYRSINILDFNCSKRARDLGAKKKKERKRTRSIISSRGRIRLDSNQFAILKRRNFSNEDLCRVTTTRIEMEEDGADNLLRRMERNGDDAIAVRYSSHVETRAELTLTPREPSPSPAAARLASRGDQRGRQHRAPLKGSAN